MCCVCNLMFLVRFGCTQDLHIFPQMADIQDILMAGLRTLYEKLLFFSVFVFLLSEQRKMEIQFEPQTLADLPSLNALFHSLLIKSEFYFSFKWLNWDQRGSAARPASMYPPLIVLTSSLLALKRCFWPSPSPSSASAADNGMRNPEPAPPRPRSVFPTILFFP